MLEKATVAALLLPPSTAYAADPSSVVSSRVDELKTLGKRAQQSGSDGPPEFWQGRLQGQAPPQPKVVLQGNEAPPVVICPGFGNDLIDYVTPLNLPSDTGLAAALERRGIQRVAVVPIKRADWINVARGLSDPKFLLGDAQPEGSTYGWYIAAAKRTVEETVAARRAESSSGDARVVLVGHSAGGWLARGLCVAAGDAWAREHVRGIVTLGAPNVQSPDGTDQTRGTIKNINLRAPGAYLAKQGTFYVTVSSRRVVGAENGDDGQKNGYTSYKLILGRSEGVVGDGFVPTEAAMLDGASQIILDCFHSGGGGDPWPKDNWYGAEANVDGWLGAVEEALAKQRAAARSTTDAVATSGVG